MKTKTKSAKQPAIPHDPYLLEKLKDHEFAAHYLMAALDGDGDPEEEFHIFLVALGNIIRAHGFKNIADQIDVPRDTLYKSFSGTGNPALRLLLKVLQVLELDFAIVPRTPVGHSAKKRA